ncbi:MAG: hypothetical protein ACRD1R_19545 [Acidobacteriota bacterium]
MAIVLVALLSPVVHLAQGRASMSSPIIRTRADGVSITANFNDFSAGKKYRIGIGTAEGSLAGATIELLKNNAPVPQQLTAFKQGYTSNWWNVNGITARGWVFDADDFAGGEVLTLKVNIPRAEIDKLKSLYIIVAKDYGSDLWYLEDGSELTEKYW